MPNHSKWLNEKQLHMRFRPNHSDRIKHEGRIFMIGEHSYLSFDDFKMSPVYYDVEEWAMFDHVWHRRTIAKNSRSRAAAERYIDGLKPLSAADRKREAKAARRERILWLGHEIVKAKKQADKWKCHAGRSYFNSSSSGKRMPKTAEHMERHRTALTAARVKLRQLKTDLRRAAKLQSA